MGIVVPTMHNIQPMGTSTSKWIAKHQSAKNEQTGDEMREQTPTHTSKISTILTLSLFLILLAFSAHAHATYFDDRGYYNIELSTDLEFLDFTETNTMTYDEVIAATSIGGVFEGWRYATIDETTHLFTSLGPHHDGWSEANFDGVREFFDVFGVPIEQPTSIRPRGQATTVWYFFFGDEYEPTRYNDTARATGTIAMAGHAHAPRSSPSGLLDADTYAGNIIEEVDEANHGYYSHLLVRSPSNTEPSHTPEPSTLMLLSLGVLGIAGVCRKRPNT